MKPLDPDTLATTQDTYCVIDMQKPRTEWIARSEPMTEEKLGMRLYELVGRGALCFVCADGTSSEAVARSLAESGAEACFLAGGMKAWCAAGLPTEGNEPR